MGAVEDEIELASPNVILKQTISRGTIVNTTIRPMRQCRNGETWRISPNKHYPLLWISQIWPGARQFRHVWTYVLRFVAGNEDVENFKRKL
tara:strand:- start:432 stop:704 length:273 start_codon:yes stop_codon:yes gene_type:complete